VSPGSEREPPPKVLPGHSARPSQETVGPLQSKRPPKERVGRLRWTCLLAGWGVIAFALHGMIADRVNPSGIFRILIELNVVNDALVAPLVIVAAAVLRRTVPRWSLVPLDVGLISSAVVTLYAYPLVGSWGKTRAAGFSRLPFDYAHSLLMVLGAIWFVCALMALWSWRWNRSTPS